MVIISVCWRDGVFVRNNADLEDWSSEEMRQRVENLVLNNADEEDDSEARFMTSAAIQALVSLTDPLAHCSIVAKRESIERRWVFSNVYFFYASDFLGNHVKASLNTSDVIGSDPRSFSVKIRDPSSVSKEMRCCS